MKEGDKSKIVVLGALGSVGREMLHVLSESPFTTKGRTIVACARDTSLGQQVSYGEDDVISCTTLDRVNLGESDIVLSAISNEDIANLAGKITSTGATLIDNSSFFRMDPDVPLIIPEINPEVIKLKSKKGIIANPNCSTVQMLLPLATLHKAFKINRIVVSTYQAVSGKGKSAIDELFNQSKNFIFGHLNVGESAIGDSENVFPRRIAFNCIPQIDVFLPSGDTREEQKMIQETKKILDESIKISATCVRVPVFHCHAESVNIEFERPFTMEEVVKILSSTDGVVFENDQNMYHTQMSMRGSNDVFVSRVRRDETLPNALNMWIVADNLRKGGALNAVQIAELLIKQQEEKL